MSPRKHPVFSVSVFRRELWASRTSLPWWSVAVVFVIVGGMGKYAAMSGSGQSINALIAKLPKAVQGLMGYGAFDLTTPDGFFAILIPYLALLLGIHAAMLGVEIVVKEQRDGTAEFLYGKPVSRAAVLNAKLASALAGCFFLWSVTLIASLVTVGSYAGDTPVHGMVVLLVASLSLVQVTFLAVGAGAAGLFREPKTAASAATGVLLATYLLSFAVDMIPELSGLRYLTPFQYASPRLLLESGGIDVIAVCITALVVAGGMIVMHRGYRARDL